jgi:hypothetical protein
LNKNCGAKKSTEKSYKNAGRIDKTIDFSAFSCYTECMKKYIEQDTTSQLNNEKIAQMSEKIGQMTTAQIAEQMVKMETLLNYYEEHFRLAQHKQFGASSEKTDADSIEQMNLFNEAKVTADLSLPEPEIEEFLYKRRKRRGKEDRLPPDVPVEMIVYDLTEAEKFHKLLVAALRPRKPLHTSCAKNLCLECRFFAKKQSGNETACG